MDCLVIMYDHVSKAQTSDLASPKSVLKRQRKYGRNFQRTTTGTPRLSSAGSLIDEVYDYRLISYGNEATSFPRGSIFIDRLAVELPH
jgi:hypothetical protein